jgi:hypothetical protein
MAPSGHLTRPRTRCRSSRHGALVLLVACAAPVSAQQPAAAAPAANPAGHSADMAVGVRLGSTGFGLQVARLLTGRIGARIGGSFYNWSGSSTIKNINYNATLNLHTFSALIDLFLSRRGSFHFTGGLITNPLTITATGQSSGGYYKINGTKYADTTVGVLTAQGQFPSVRPYFGLRFGTPANEGGGFALLFDLGAIIAKPTISLTATGAATNQQLGSDLAAQSSQTQQKLDKSFKVYPVLALGLAYHF